MRRGARGFTLVEVLVAVAVVAIALGAGLRAAGALIDNAQRAQDIMAAQWCADNQLTNLKLARQFPAVGETAFGCQQLGRDYAGTLRAAPTPNPNFLRVDAVVADDDGHVLITLSTVVSRF
jgi:general secretion pathway protein I